MLLVGRGRKAAQAMAIASMGQVGEFDLTLVDDGTLDTVFRVEWSQCGHRYEIRITNDGESGIEREDDGAITSDSWDALCHEVDIGGCDRCIYG